MLYGEVVRQWDYRAMHIGEEAINAHLYQFDLSVWKFLKDLCHLNPTKAACQFRLSEHMVSCITRTEIETLKLLASGVCLSLKLDTEDEVILRRLAQSDDALSHIHQEAPLLHTAYWLLLHQTAHQDIAIATVSFGISKQLAHAIAKASYNQLLDLAYTEKAHFSLRCSDTIIEEIMRGKHLTYLLLKRAQQSFGDIRK